MTTKQIDEKQALEVAKFEAAKTIRQTLDAMLKKYPEDERADVESEILDMVTGDE